MPLIVGNSDLKGTGLRIAKSYVEIYNFQIQNYLEGISSTANNTILNNVIVNNIGLQVNNSIQLGRAVHLFGDNSIIENSFIWNSNGEGINVKGANNCIIRNTSVYSDNVSNPTGYYFLISGNGKNNLVENCIAYRDPKADLHQGHGLMIKDQGMNNVFKGCVTYNTGIEVAFSGVYNNTFEDCKIYGNYSKYRNQFSCILSVNNGAHDNTFKNIYISDSRYAIKFHDFDDGYVGIGGDRDKQEGGSNNKFIGILVNKAQNAVGATSNEIGAKAFSNNNEFIDCTFKNISSTPFFSYQKLTNTKFVNCKFENIPSKRMIDTEKGGSFPISFQNCTFSNIGFPRPK